MKTLHMMECSSCRKPLETYWDDNEDGTTKGLMRGDYELWGDFIFCLPCDKKLTDDYESYCKGNI